MRQHVKGDEVGVHLSGRMYSGINLLTPSATLLPRSLVIVVKC